MEFCRERLLVYIKGREVYFLAQRNFQCVWLFCELFFVVESKIKLICNYREGFQGKGSGKVFLILIMMLYDYKVRYIIE